MLVPLAIASTAVAIGMHAALLPQVTPGPLDVPQEVRDRAAVLWLLCWAPAIRYTVTSRADRRPIPFLPVVGILYGLYYALSPALGIANLWGRDPITLSGVTPIFDPAREYAHPVDLALSGWVVCLVAYTGMASVWHPGLPRMTRRLSGVRGHTLRACVHALVAIGLVALVFRHMELPIANTGPAQMLIFLSQGGLLLLIVWSVRGRLSRAGRLLTLLLVLGAFYLQLGAGATGSVLHLSFVIFVGMLTAHGNPRLRYIVAGGVVVAGCVAIRGVMRDWRQEVWADQQHSVSPLYRSQALVRLLGESVDRNGVAGAVGNGWEVIASRSSNIELLADVMRRTPSQVAYWNGATYESLTGALVPRLVWPDKPTKTLGQDFGHRYSYLLPNDLTTSINLPALVEFYINFGDDGIVVGMFLVGVIFALLEGLINVPGQSVVVTAAAAPVLAQLFVMESDLSLQFGGLPLQLFVLWALGIGICALEARRRGARRFFISIAPPGRGSERGDAVWQAL
jgi:hypothetical protein